MATNWITDVLNMFKPPTTAPTDKISVLTLAGTGAIDPKTGAANFPAQIAALLDPDKFVWVPVAYPAAFPFKWSVDQGVVNTGTAIRSIRGKYVALGFSQGAMVLSRIRQILTAGDLAKRNADCLGMVVMGNPCRLLDTTFPGYDPPPGHHGIADAAHRLTNTDARWWEMVIPGDLAADIGDDLTGQWLSTLFMDVWTGGNPKDAVITTMKASPVDLSGFLPEVMAYFGLGQVAGAAHTQYDTYVPPTIGGAPNTKTMVQLAADHINSLAA